MQKKHFSSWYKLIRSMVLLAIALCVMIIGLIMTSSTEGMGTFVLVLFGGVFVAMLIGLLHESCAFWVLEEDRIIYRQLFGRRKMIMRQKMETIRKSSIDMPLFFPCNEYVIESPQGTIRIVINNENRRLLETYFGM